MVIRAYETSDLDAVIAIFQSAIRGIASADYSPPQIAAWASVDRSAFAAQRASRPTWIASVGSMPAGFADLEPDGHIDMLYVDFAHRRRGVARALLKAVACEADRLGLDALVTEASITARPFFAAQGFRVVAPDTVSKNGQTFQRYRMRRDVVRPRRARDR
ncbi:GNAT family N-acetyltransferase [Methylobacterium sp. C25]|nr:GNAT family N-acetyltransferase [Methylobacterium sp. C25]